MKFIIGIFLFVMAFLIAADAPQSDIEANEDGAYTLYLPSIYTENIATSAVPVEPADGPHVFGETYSGDATFYAADGSGHCSFERSPYRMLVVALNTADYADSALCGSFLLVSGPKGDVVVRVVDECPGCGEHDIDLSPEAFEMIADLSDGRVQVTWQLYSPDVAQAVSLYFEASSTEWWTAVQVRDHRTPLATVEYLTDDGTYSVMERTNWNFYTASNMGAGPFTFRMTDIFGNSIVESDVPLTAGETYIGMTQFPHAP